MSSTLRPSRPPLALMSSRQTSMPSCEALPPPARPPVCAIDMPILIGGCCASALEPRPATATAIAPPRNVLRFIGSPSFCRCSLSFRLRRISARSLRIVDVRPRLFGSNRRGFVFGRLLDDRRRIGAHAPAGLVGLALARKAHVEADARHPLDRTVRIVCHHVDGEIAGRAEYDIVCQMRVVAQIERGDQFAIPG